MKGIYKFEWDCGRSGNMEGLFIADSEDIKKLIESDEEIYFGEVLGKHSEVYGTIEKDDITLVSDDLNSISVFEKLDLSMGCNPLEYLKESE